MMNSLFAGVSGLRNHLTKMDVIGNNIANINTLGFKAGRTTFKEMLAQTIRGASRQRAATGGVNPLQYGLGMAVASIDNIFSQGGLEMTGKSTDLAIQGKQLQDRFLHPTHVIEEDTRKEMADWYMLFLKATLGGDERARRILQHDRKYRPAGWEYKADLTSATFPVPDVVDAEILAFAREKSIALQDARIWPMVSEKMSFPAESTSPTVAWGSTTSESTPTVAEVELTALELSAYSSIRNPLLQDTRSDIVSWLTELMAEAQGLELDDCMFNGDGAAASASCSGVLSAAAGYSVVFGTGSTNFSEIGATHLSQLISKLDGLKKVGAKFYMNGAVFHYVRDLKDDNGRPIFLNTLGDPVSGTILGYPYREAIKCPGTSAAATGFVVFGNLKYFAVGRRLDSTTLEANPWASTPWTGNKTWFKLYQRWALKIALANGFARLVTHS